MLPSSRLSTAPPCAAFSSVNEAYYSRSIIEVNVARISSQATGLQSPTLFPELAGTTTVVAMKQHYQAAKRRLKNRLTNSPLKSSRSSTNTPIQEHSKSQNTGVAIATYPSQSSPNTAVSTRDNHDRGNESSRSTDTPLADNPIAHTEDSLSQQSLL
jgi:hypothetical protein